MKLLREYIRNLLKEDEAKQVAYAKDLGELSGWDATREEAGSFMDDFESAEAKAKAYKKMMQSGRVVKKLYAKYTDRAFLDSLVTVHWTDDPLAFLSDSSPRDELSANAYLPGNVDFDEPYGKYGIIIKGYITLLANDMDSLMTGGGASYAEIAPERTKMSGANKGIGSTKDFDPDTFDQEFRHILVFDKEDWDPIHVDSNEALVDNWRPQGIITWDLKAKKELVTTLEEEGIDIPVHSRGKARKLS